MTTPPVPKNTGCWWRALLLILSAVVPAALVQLTARPPAERRIHVESFRYGKDPYEIRVNRGDTLHLTFSARDTGHSFFLDEFDIDAKVTPGDPEVILFRPSDPQAPPERTREVVLTAVHPGLLGALVSKSNYRCHVWCGPMHAFEHGELIIEPNTLLWAGLGLLLGLLLVGLAASRAGPGRGRESLDLLDRMPRLKRLLKRRGFQFACVAVASVVFYLVVLAALFGTKMAGRNLGIMLTWVVWLFLLICVLTPLGGRLWCLACPLPYPGEAVQRGALTGVRRGKSSGTHNRLFGLGCTWPSWLPGSWLRTGVLLVLGTFSTLLVAEPRFTGWVLLGMVAVALIMALVFEQRAFCRHLCPIAAFVATYGKTGRLALRSKSAAVCAGCTVRTCQRGSEHGWACPYGLCVAEIGENDDCGLCTECVKTCVYDNVALQWRPFAGEHGLRGTGEAVTAVVLLVLGAAYCVVHLGPWPGIRDAVNILDKGNWGLFGIYAAVLWGTALAAAPALVLAAAAAGWALGRTNAGVAAAFRAAAAGLVPFGLTVWMAFVLPMLTVNATFVLQSLSDPLGWGWDFFGTAGLAWHPLWPRAVPFIQVGLILFGFARGLRTSRRAWEELAGNPRRALAGMLPSVLLLAAVAGWLIVFFAD